MKSEEWWDWWCDMWAESDASSCDRDRVLAGEAERKNETVGWIVGLIDCAFMPNAVYGVLCTVYCVAESTENGHFFRLRLALSWASAQFESSRPLLHDQHSAPLACPRGQLQPQPQPP